MASEVNVPKIRAKSAPTGGGVQKHYGTRLQCKECMSVVNTSTETTNANYHSMITRGATTSAARNAVFNTQELLENILSNLPENDLLVVRGVNVHWNATIMTSPKLQRKLFLLPEPVTTKWISEDKGTLIREDTNDEWQLPDQTWTVPARMNPLLFKPNPAYLRESFARRIEACEPLKLLSRPALSRMDYVHQRMLLCQPPTKDIQFTFYYNRCRRKERRSGEQGFHHHDQEEGDRVTIKLQNVKGVTLGDMLRAFHAAVGAKVTHRPSTEYSIKLRWSMVWLSGVVFPTEGEKEMVKRALKGC